MISYFAIEFLLIQCYHHHDAISDEEKGDLQTLMKTAFSLQFATMMTSFEIKSFQLISKGKSFTGGQIQFTTALNLNLSISVLRRK